MLLGLAFGRRLEVGAGSGCVALGRPQAMALQELEHPLPHPVGLELVGEDGRDRHRQPLRDVRDRKMRAGDGVEEPLFAEGVRSEPLHVGHVAVQNDSEVASNGRSRPGGRSIVADGDEVEGLLEALGAQGEVRRRDRRDEAVVERLRQPGGAVEAVPSEADRGLVHLQLSGVEEAEHLDRVEVRRQQLAILADVVLDDVPGVLGLLDVRAGEREAVRGRDERGGRDPGDLVEQLRRVVDVLDGLQEDHGVDGLVELLDEPTAETQVRSPVAQASVLVGLGVGVDADHLRG